MPIFPKRAKKKSSDPAELLRMFSDAAQRQDFAARLDAIETAILAVLAGHDIAPLKRDAHAVVLPADAPAVVVDARDALLSLDVVRIAFARGDAAFAVLEGVALGALLVKINVRPFERLADEGEENLNRKGKVAAAQDAGQQANADAINAKLEAKRQQNPYLKYRIQLLRLIARDEGRRGDAVERRAKSMARTLDRSKKK